MKTLLKVSCAAALLAGFGISAVAGTLDNVRDRGTLLCGVNESNPGFAYADEQGVFHGFDVDFCRATAAAIGTDVEFVLLTGAERFPALQSGEVDLLYRSTTWTMSRDTDLGFEYQGVNWYDGQAFMVREASGIKSLSELDGAAICVVQGSTAELTLADYFAHHGMAFTPVVFAGAQDVRNAYDAGRCDAFTNEIINLAAQGSALADPLEHRILPEVISKEPFGPVTREGDDEWGDVVRWVLNAIITAEEEGVTQANVIEMRDTSNRPGVQRLLGTSGNFGEYLGLDESWAVRAIAAVGNYAEIFERNFGPNTPINVERGMNELWINGGLLYAPPIR